MKKVFLLATLVILTFSFNGSSSTNQVPSFLPENDRYIGVNDKKASRNMTEEVFNSVIARIEKIYSPIIKSRGKVLNISGNWDDGTVNAYASQSGRTWSINLFGGLARHQETTPDSFAMVVCHEMGHHIGGLPKKTSWFGPMWASSEGQADYYSSAKCVKRYFAEDNNVAIVAEMKIDPIADAKCNQVFSGPEEVAMCKRAAMAGLGLGKLFEDLLDLAAPILFSTPDNTVVTQTNTAGYPGIQCRFDTYFAGALCDQDFSVDPDDDSVNGSFCATSENYILGVRPTCWYRPSSRD